MVSGAWGWNIHQVLGNSHLQEFGKCCPGTSQVVLVIKNPPDNAGDVGWIPGLREISIYLSNVDDTTLMAESEELKSS